MYLENIYPIDNVTISIEADQFYSQMTFTIAVPPVLCGKYMYAHHKAQWPSFTWDAETVAPQLASVRHKQGRLTGRMESPGFFTQKRSDSSNLDVIKTSAIEGQLLDAEQVRSPIARKLAWILKRLSKVLPLLSLSRERKARNKYIIISGA